MGLINQKNRARAVEQITAIRTMAESGQAGAVIWYRGLTAEEMYQLQCAARQAGIVVKVIRNRLAHRAVEGTAFACLQPVLEGPVLLAFSSQGPGAMARFLKEFRKKHENLVVKYLSFEGELHPASDLDSMANLPTKEEAIAQLLSTLQLPMRQLLRVLAEPQTKLVRLLEAIKNK